MNLSVSQNFLQKEELVEKLVRMAGIDVDDVVLDIGSGIGIISKILSKYCKKVLSIEYDEKLLKLQKDNLRNIKNIEFIQKNFLDMFLPSEEYKVFSNIPFNITSEVVTKLLFGKNPPKTAFLIIQKEASLRFMGVGEGTLISLLLKPFFDMSIAYKFNKTDFFPVPNVDIVLLKIEKKINSDVLPDNADLYRDFMSYVVNQQKESIKLRTSKIFTNEQILRLSKDLGFKKESHVDDLSYAHWLGLFNYFVKGVSSEKKEIVEGAYKDYLRSRNAQPKVNRTKLSING